MVLPWCSQCRRSADASGRCILHTSNNHVNNFSSENIWHRCTLILQKVRFRNRVRYRHFPLVSLLANVHHWLSPHQPSCQHSKQCTIIANIKGWRDAASIFKALKYLCTNHGNQRFFQFKIFINISSFHFIWIHTLRGMAITNIFYSYSAGVDFQSQILTSNVDPRAVMVNNGAAYVCKFSIFTCNNIW